MRPVTTDYTQSLEGSRHGDRVVADVWRGGDLLIADARLSRWSLTTDMSRQVRTQGSLTIEDPGGDLAPWAADDALSVGGSRVVLTYISPQTDTSITLGEYVITRSDATETWSSRRVSKGVSSTGAVIMAKTPVWTVASSVSLEIADLTQLATEQPFVGPAPAKTSTVISEITYLMDGILPVRNTGVSDLSIPSGYVHEGNPLSAVEALLRLARATYRVTTLGELEIMPLVPPWPPAWEVQFGERGVLVDVSRSFSRSDMVNFVAVVGKDAAGNPVTGTAAVTSGPLSIDGPHGRVMRRIDTDLATTNQQCTDLAMALLASDLSTAAIEMPVTCLPHMGLECHDVVTVRWPIGPVSTPVRSISLSGDAAGVQPMRLGVLAYLSDLRAIRQAVTST